MEYVNAQYGCKIYLDSYVASDGSCFMVIWTIFENHLLEVGQTQDRENWETMALRTLTTVDSKISNLVMYFYEECNNIVVEAHIVKCHTWSY